MNSHLKFAYSIFSLFIIPHAFLASAQFPVYKNYTVKDGLPSEVVYSALQDHLGFIWFATDAGVSRFDGLHFKKFTVKDGLADNDVIGLFEDVWNRLWFLSFNGRLSYFRDDSIFNETTDSTLVSVMLTGEITNVYQRANGNFWLSYNSGALLEIGKSGVLKGTKFIENGHFIWCFPHEVSSREYWVFTRNGCYKFRDHVKDTLLIDHFKPLENYYFNMKSSGNGESFFNNADGIRCLKENRNVLVIPASEIPNYSQVTVVLADKNGDLWMFTKQRTTSYWKKEGGHYTPGGTFFSGIQIGYVFTDNEKNIWFCSIGRGVFEIQPGGLESHTYKDDIPQANQIQCVTRCPDSSVWYANSYGNLYILRNDSTVKISFPTSLIKVRKIIFKDDYAYIATNIGLFRKSIKSSLIPAGISSAPPQQICDHNITNFAFDKQGELFLCTAQGIFKALNYEGGTASLIMLPHVESVRIYCLLFDQVNTLWYSNYSSLYFLKPDSLDGYPELNHKFQSRITAICRAPDKTLLVATYGDGIYVFRNSEVFFQLATETGLAGDLCTHLFVEKDTVYVSTRSGLSIFQLNGNKIPVVKNITTADGILSNDINAICISGSKIFLATSEGLCSVDKNIGETRSDAPRIYITSVTAGKEKQENLQSLSVPFNTGIEIAWTALTYQQPGNLSFQYRLQNGSWTSAKSTAIYLSSLSPAHYDFQVRSRKINSDWSNPVLLAIDITPLFWQQWWFQIAMMLLLVTVSVLIGRMIIVKRYQHQMVFLRQQQELAEERNRIAADMHDDFGGDLCNLLMLTRLVQRNTGMPPNEKKQLEKMEHSVSGAIIKMDEIIWALNPKHDSIADLIHLLQKYILDFKEAGSEIIVEDIFPEKITEKTISSKFRRNIMLVVKEALNNILKHSRASHVVFSLALDVDFLKMEISDNGTGIHKTEKITGGNGLFNMHKRITEIDGMFQIMPGPGTAIHIKVPI